MKQVLRLKRKIYYFINAAFYIGFFVIGFLLGGGSFEKIKDFIPNIFN